MYLENTVHLCVQQQHVAWLHQALTAEDIHLQHMRSLQNRSHQLALRCLNLQSVHSCPKGDKWQVNTPNSLSLYSSTAHFSFASNNAGWRVFFVGAAGAWITWGGNRTSNYSFFHLFFLWHPTIAHTLKIQATEFWWNHSKATAWIPDASPQCLAKTFKTLVLFFLYVVWLQSNYSSDYNKFRREVR